MGGVSAGGVAFHRVRSRLGTVIVRGQKKRGIVREVLVTCNFGSHRTFYGRLNVSRDAVTGECTHSAFPTS